MAHSSSAAATGLGVLAAALVIIRVIAPLFLASVLSCAEKETLEEFLSFAYVLPLMLLFDMRKGGGGGGRGPPARRSQYRVTVTGLPPTGSWQDLKDHMREAGDVCYSDVFKDGTGVVEYMRREDMKYALKKLDDTKFKSHEGETSYVRVREDDGGRGGGSGRRSMTRSRSRSGGRSRGSPTYSPRREERSRSRGGGRDRSRSRSGDRGRKSRSGDRSRSRSRS